MRPPTAAALIILGCSTGAARQAGRPIDTLPLFTPEQSAWFDDAIAADPYGLEALGADADADSAIYQRTAFADSVVPVVISTVTSDTYGTAFAYQLVFSPTGPSLVGDPQKQPVTVTVPPTSAAYPFVRAADATLIGRRLVLFLRRFSRGGEAVLHWHAELDRPEVRRSVARAAQLALVRR
jgi:hypothetical protein